MIITKCDKLKNKYYNMDKSGRDINKKGALRWFIFRYKNWPEVHPSPLYLPFSRGRSFAAYAVTLVYSCLVH